ncbi:NAD+ synthase (glutamine-hydrolysing) [Fontimonas thermophila]|uniref:Glutamine-dependent NAD(+) synthetase n=1 Tax=Fontimonas thermophila TaxID=1076937 RepID=A0A1I2I891_9GAMM|nr:NAD+ synthase [Fontimonas thermophila]SFF38485.1 NAD+ synthase (glutamine-hydrolysing) [Fontimonas thermophila]
MAAQFKLALAQLNLWVGDVEGNVQKIIEAAVYARDRLGASLLACPELSLIGYPPDDLLLRSAMPRAIEEGVQRLLHEIGGITVVFGLPEYTQEGAQRVIYNAAYVIRDGRIVARTRKQLLPNYGVFDERRHFRPGTGGTLVFTHEGVNIGLCICEDLWGPGPAAAARAAGAELLLNINASPFELNKTQARRCVFDQRVAETGLPIVYVNCVGGQDDVLFDGDSCAVGGDGCIGFAAPLFEEGVFAVTFAGGRVHGSVRETLPIEAIVYKGLVQAVRDYVDRNGFPGALVGMSGGIDSAVVAAIAADALGPARVWGVSLPSRYTAAMSNDDARLEAEALGIRYSLLPIEPMFQTVTATLSETFAGYPVDLTEENIQSRCRGLLLMALSNKFGHVVLTTGNKSEMAVGYATLYGDMCGGFAPLKDVYKTLVYKLACYRNGLSPERPVIPERVILRPPSAELRPDQKDSDSLPPYEVLDPVLEAYVEDQLSIPEIVARGFDASTVKRVAALVRRSEYKRRQAPPGPKITRCAFGRERRYPLTAVYGDL